MELSSKWWHSVSVKEPEGEISESPPYTIATVSVAAGTRYVDKHLSYVLQMPLRWIRNRPPASHMLGHQPDKLATVAVSFMIIAYREATT